jgi:CheY-like chemotaxis protein
VAAVNGKEGIEPAERERPDLVLMDLSLPVIDGWEATRRLKTNPALKNIPVRGSLTVWTSRKRTTSQLSAIAWLSRY